jgi:hypothetical protein
MRMQRMIFPMALLILMCGETPKSAPVPTTAPRVARPAATRVSTDGGERIELLMLDSKTSVPFEDRDKTDQRFFHGFAIMKNANVREDDVTKLDDLLKSLRGTRWRADVVREADYGIRVRGATGLEDLLVCTYCTPAVIARTTEATEAELSPESAKALRAIITSALQHE